MSCEHWFIQFVFVILTSWISFSEFERLMKNLISQSAGVKSVNYFRNPSWKMTLSELFCKNSGLVQHVINVALCGDFFFTDIHIRSSVLHLNQCNPVRWDTCSVYSSSGNHPNLSADHQSIYIGVPVPRGYRRKRRRRRSSREATDMDRDRRYSHHRHQEHDQYRDIDIEEGLMDTNDQSLLDIRRTSKSVTRRSMNLLKPLWLFYMVRPRVIQTESLLPTFQFMLCL